MNWNEVSLEEVLTTAIADELAACDYYRHAAALTGNSHTRALLVRLSDMEQGHADSLRVELDNVIVQREMESGMVD